MRTSTIVLFTFIGMGLWACSKTNNLEKESFHRQDFFNNTRDALMQTSHFLALHDPLDSLIAITHITYVDAPPNTYAFVYYKSKHGFSNLVFKQPLFVPTKEAITTIKCDGTQCECKVKVLLTNDGQVNIDCSCNSCTKSENHLELSTNQ